MQKTIAAQPALCLAPTGHGPCWRKAKHHGKHVRQHPAYDSRREPIMAIAEDGVVSAAASRAMADVVHNYAAASGCHVIDLDTYSEA